MAATINTAAAAVSAQTLPMEREEKYESNKNEEQNFGHEPEKEKNNE